MLTFASSMGTMLPSKNAYLVVIMSFLLDAALWQGNLLLNAPIIGAVRLGGKVSEDSTVGEATRLTLCRAR
jgi:hypothetical protein